MSNDYKSPARALAGAIAHITSHYEDEYRRLTEARFGQRAALGGGYYYVLHFSAEIVNGEQTTVRQTAADQIELAVKGWEYAFAATKMEEIQGG